MFQKTQNADYLAIVENRVQADYLTWCEQFLDLIEENADATGGLSLNDVGCCAGQFYKSLKRRGLPLDYQGFDIEPAYLAIARRVFPELAEAVHIRDIEKEGLPPADITVVSATLEHLDAPGATVGRLLQNTRKLALFRTFLGDVALDQWRHKPNATKPYRIRQFERDAFVANVEEHGFRVDVVEDRYTHSRPLKIDAAIVRSQYVVVAHRL
jgi:SAM-dependent methyltransferase